MPAVTRIGDSLSTGHGCAGTTTIASTLQSTVKADGILIAIVGAPTVSHAFPPNPPCAPHVAQLNALLSHLVHQSQYHNEDRLLNRLH